MNYFKRNLKSIIFIFLDLSKTPLYGQTVSLKFL